MLDIKPTRYPSGLNDVGSSFAVLEVLIVREDRGNLGRLLRVQFASINSNPLCRLVCQPEVDGFVHEYVALFLVVLAETEDQD
jgi:hypothetical protein